jgi:hypothetical protein
MHQSGQIGPALSSAPQVPDAPPNAIPKNKPRQRLRAAPHPHAFAFTIADAQAMGAPSASKIYELVRDSKLRLVKVGARSLINGDDLRKLLGVDGA